MSEKKERLLTPAGLAKWAHVYTPKEAFKDKNGKSQGAPKYQIDVYFSDSDPAWKDWGAKIMAYTRSKGMKNSPIKKELNEDDTPTGRFYVQFQTGEQYKPGVFDKFNQPTTELIGNDSKVVVAYNSVDYDGFGGGVKLYLNAVQVLELVPYQKHSAETYGFKSEPKPVEEKPAPGNAPPPEDDLPF